MLFLHTSNHLEQLAKQFAQLTREPLKQVFESEKVIVQNAGMARWLSLNLADATGICANMEALFPAEFMWQLLASVLTDVPEQDPCAPAVLRWRLMRILLKHPDEFPELSHYVVDEVSAWDLASQLSHLLDQYLFYRDDWIRDWESPDKKEAIASDDWQARLWQKAISDNHLTHWLALQDQFVKAVNQLDVSKLPERVLFFSLSALSPGYLRLLGELATKTDVHLFIINPCMEYWGDIQSEKHIARLPADQQDYYESGNPLLSSMGRQGRDFLDQLLELPNAQEITHWQQSKPESLLQHLQNDILYLKHPSAYLKHSKEDSSNTKNDQSIQFHACHTPMREVEVLHDQLLDVIQKNPGISPTDIVVMMPDIETYAPYIEAVFSTPVSNASSANSLYQLPFSIADRNPARSQQAIEALLKVLDLVDSRFDAESVFELLGYAEIRDNFDLQENEVFQCRELVRATNIRWGISAETRQQDDLPDTPEHTWCYALDRMLLGYAMPGDALFYTQAGVDSAQAHLSHDLAAGLPLLPYNEIEGSNAQMLARLKCFTEVIFRVDNWSKQNLAINDWLEKLNQLIQELLTEQGQTEDLFKTLESLKQQSQLAEFDDEPELPFSVIRKILKQSLQEVSGSENFMGYGITFCALVPMRSVPFKVVALLGMNDGEFPRRNKHHSFDRMAEKPKKGDRSRRDEDRYLFLESILAAREKLIISYIGQSVQDNSELPPSVLVSELLDNLANYDDVAANHAANKNVKDRVIKHPLQAFSPRYFNSGSSKEPNKLFSYVKEYVELYQLKKNQQKGKTDGEHPSQVFLESPLEALDAGHKQISLDDLIAFYQSPARELLKKRFAIKTFDKELGLPVREPFELESFVDRAVRDQVLKAKESEKAEEINSDEALLVSRAKGLLPHGEIGDEIFAREQRTIETFAQQLPELSPLDNHAFMLEIGDFQLGGELTQLTETGRVIQQTGDAYARDYISLWINHLVLNTQSFNPGQSTSCFYSPESQFSLSPLLSDTDDAKTHLKALLEYYWKGMSFPLYFFPKPAFKMYEKGKEKGLIKLATDAWENSFLGTSEKDKFENWLLYRAYNQDELFGEEFETVSELVFGGMYRCYVNLLIE